MSKPFMRGVTYAQDMVRLYQFPRNAHIPNMSPFCLKLETFLRHAGIKHEAICSLDNWKKGKEGKFPWIELNGQPYHDSDFIMQKLTNHFKLDHLEADLTDEQKGTTRAVLKMVEQSLFETALYNRFMENLETFLTVGRVKIPMKSLLMPFVKYFLHRKIHTRMEGVGLGRHTREEIYSIAKTDVKALSQLLGDKQFFFGDKPHNIDIIVWSVLAESYYMPWDNMIKGYIKDSKNLDGFMGRMKQHFWPDWEEITAKPKKNAQNKEDRGAS
uniref:Glutathione S-transferase n=1 Tax=Plectus sambesii TaxID=2011161 RepID=A0A914XCK9_9BILA